jgi:hypothetical protein
MIGIGFYDLITFPTQMICSVLRPSIILLGPPQRRQDRDAAARTGVFVAFAEDNWSGNPKSPRGYQEHYHGDENQVKIRFQGDRRHGEECFRQKDLQYGLFDGEGVQVKSELIIINILTNTYLIFSYDV